MIKLFLRLWLPVALILTASAVLLLTDRERARGGVRPSRPSEEGRPSRNWKIGLAAFVESSPIEEAIGGFRRGLEEAGFVDGRDFTISTRNAQGDIATLNAILDHLNGDDIDLIATFSTPAFQWRAAQDRAEAGRLRRRVRSDHDGRSQVGCGPPAERDRSLLALPRRRDDAAGSRGLPQGGTASAPCSHPAKSTPLSASDSSPLRSKTLGWSW